MNTRSAIIALVVASLALIWAVLAWTTPAKPGLPPPDQPSLSASTEVTARSGEPIHPLPPTPALNPGKLALGRQLFFDTRLSGDNSLSCASCHVLEQGGADNKPVSVGVNGALGEINAPSVLNAANNFRQFWDGRAATLEEQAAGPVTNPREMAATWPQVIDRLNADGELRAAFLRNYPDGVTRQNITAAIAEFERSLPRPSRFDRWLRGEHNAISSAEQNGYQLFKKHGCVGCHQGVNIGGNLFQRFGVMSSYFAGKNPVTHADLGRYNITGREEDRYVFKVPSLRNVELTAPYFHDASASTLEDAVRTMGRLQLGLDLPDQDVGQIVAFLKSLTTEPPR